MTPRIKPPVSVFSALGDATRCRIVELLLEGARPVHQLSEAFSISRPAISRHLRVLKSAGLVAEVKKGRENLYALRPARLKGAAEWIEMAREITAPVRARKVAVSVAQPEVVAPEPLAALEVALEAIEKSPRRRKAPEAISQMGFDF